MLQLLVSLAGALVSLSAVRAAEVRGTVTVEYQGMFVPDSSTPVYPVSVALLPARGQRMVHRRPRVERVEIVDNRMHPAFFTVKKGDRVKFINRDEVFHELFTLSPGEPVSLQLGKVSSRTAQQSLLLDHVGTTHFFCRIHSKSYARIEVVDTPYLQMVKPGHQFHFTGLAAGEWILRLASADGETRRQTVTAMTSPIPLRLTVVSRGGGSGSVELRPESGIAGLFRRQGQ